MKDKKFTQGLGVAYSDFKTYLFYKVLYDEMSAGTNNKSLFQVGMSRDGLGYGLIDDSATIKTTGGKKEDIGKVSDFRISDFGNFYILTYLLDQGKKQSLCIAQSSDLVNWIKKSEISEVNEVGMVVPAYKFEDQFVLYFGRKAIRTAYSKDLKTWKVNKKPVFVPNKKDGQNILMGSVDVNAEGILVLFYQRKEGNVPDKYSVKAMLFDERNPEKSMWKSQIQIWDQIDDWTNQNVNPVGLIKMDGRLISYWQNGQKNVFALLNSFYDLAKDSVSHPKIRKFTKNPVLMPLIDNFWESKAVFNPTALYDEEAVHLIYRAVGDHDISTFGYACSKDGLHIDKRLKKPVYYPRMPFEGVGHKQPNKFSPFVSGPGFGGCEDPRITKIGDCIYMIYVAFNGWSPPRLALTSIKTKDFHNHNWDWKEPVLISRPGAIDKSGCILPEKVGGKYVIFHRVFPDILIDFVDSLEFDGETFLDGEYRISPRRDSWDSRKIGVGPTPIKTKDGWLVIYNAVDDRDDSKYKVGAMLLDLEDPTRVLHRSNSPILEPTESYENHGLKFGVVYPCGAVVVDERLLVYYGGSDMVVCTASANLPKFLAQLKNTESAKLEIAETHTYHPLNY